jgi:glutathionylspermidine synthase
VRLVPFAADSDRFTAVIEHLRFTFHKWDAYLNGNLRVLNDALVLNPEEHAHAVDCCTRINAALGRAESIVRDNPDLMERIAISRDLHPIIQAEAASHRQIARYDLFPTAHGWMIPEFNEDAPGGFNEAVAANALFAGLTGRACIAGDFGAAFIRSIPPGGTVGVVYATGYAEDLQHMLILSDLLRDRGVGVVLGSPEHLTCGRFGRPRLMNTPVDWILRFFPGEWFHYLDDLRAWRRAVTKIPVVNPLSRLIRQSKGLFALWREEALLDAADTRLLNRHTPHTEFFKTDHIADYLARREHWVMKKIFGRMGDGVLIGRLCTPEAWQKAVAAAAGRPGDYIAQHAFSPQCAHDGARMLYPALGVYLIDGAFAGYYSRADEAGFTTHEAYYAVTAVETA